MERAISRLDRFTEWGNDSMTRHDWLRLAIGIFITHVLVVQLAKAGVVKIGEYGQVSWH